jgi:hypothetical protein
VQVAGDDITVTENDSAPAEQRLHDAVVRWVPDTGYGMSDRIDAACQLRLRGDIPATSFVQTKVLLGSISEFEKFEEIRGNLPSCADTNYRELV